MIVLIAVVNLMKQLEGIIPLRTLNARWPQAKEKEYGKS